MKLLRSCKSVNLLQCSNLKGAVARPGHGTLSWLWSRVCTKQCRKDKAAHVNVRILDIQNPTDFWLNIKYAFKWMVLGFTMWYTEEDIPLLSALYGSHSIKSVTEKHFIYYYVFYIPKPNISTSQHRMCVSYFWSVEYYICVANMLEKFK